MPPYIFKDVNFEGFDIEFPEFDLKDVYAESFSKNWDFAKCFMKHPV